MLTFPSCISRTARGARGVLARWTAALFGVAMIASASAQTVQFTSSVYQLDENAGSIRIALSRLGNRNTAFSVVFTASNGAGVNGAQSGQHFVARTCTLDFATNEVLKTFDITILDNGETNA